LHRKIKEEKEEEEKRRNNFFFWLEREFFLHKQKFSCFSENSLESTFA